jgi:diguanylate cyclase (GGDEF)-like protein
MYSVPGRDAAGGAGFGDVYVVETDRDPELDAIVSVLRDVLETPTCLVALSQRAAASSKAARAAPQHANLGLAFRHFLNLVDEVEVVEDLRRDARFAQHPFVAGDPHVRFLLGASLSIGAGAPAGALLALGFEPRKVTPSQRRTAAHLARAAAGVLRWRGAAQDAQKLVREFETERRSLAVREQRLLQTERIAKVGSWEFDLASGAVEWSDEAYRIYEAPVGAPVNFDTAIEACATYERERLKALLDELVQTGASYDSEFDLVTAAGVYKRVRTQGAREEHGGVARRIFGTFQDVTDEHLTKRQLWRAANYDSLTGLANRNRFDELLVSSDAAAALLVVDADYLKDINDTLGHAAGDELLRLVARSLIESAGPKSTVARVGGDEFAIIVPPPVDAEALQSLANQITGNMQRPICFHGNNLRATVSIGGAVRGPGQDSESLRQAADLALYHAKANRRGDYVLYREEMKADIAARAFAVKTVDEALLDGRVHAYYQPVVELATGNISAFEALARVHYGDGECSIGQFSEALHDSRTATRITARILECIERDTLAWRQAGVEPPRIAVNLGPRDFQEGAIESMLRATCERAGIEPSMLAIEVTESVFISRNANIVSDTAARLRARGHIVALDDFGTGHASLAHLATFPVDVIKMDRTFIMEMKDGGSGVAIAESLIELAHKLGVQVIAEGVESESQLDQLIELNCDKVQGYLFCRPLSPKDITHLLSPKKTGALARSTIYSGSKAFETFKSTESAA